jgi:hypothetical protein
MSTNVLAGGAKLDRASLQDLSREDVIELLQDRAEGGINLSFTGKVNARRMARQVRPRVTRNQQRISCGDAERRREPTSSQTIDGVTSQTLSAQWQTVRMVSDGAN